MLTAFKQAAPLEELPWWQCRGVEGPTVAGPRYRALVQGTNLRDR